MNREDMLRRARERKGSWDMVVVGGGASGMGVVVDAAARYEVLLLEQADFGKGTSSRSTTLVHGGVRYLEQGNISLVMEALKERGLLRQNAPHLVSDLAFVVPNYEWWEAPFYGIGLKVYNLLAGQYGFGSSEILSREETLARLPTIKPEGLRGGVVYYDGQFDDARLIVNQAATAAEQGGTLLNYAPVTAFLRDTDGFLDGVLFRDLESGEALRAEGKVVVNCAGPFCDSVRRLADPAAAPLLAPSQGVHLVFDGSFLPARNAIMVPHTRDGRVMFAIPWHGHTVVGTTDTPIEASSRGPCPRRSRSSSRRPVVGVRPLVRSWDRASTAALSRDHTIHIDATGLLTLTGGKWTTYRNMAEDAVNQAATLARLPERPCPTRGLNIHGFHQTAEKFGPLSFYGADALLIQDLVRAEPALGAPLHEALPYTGAEVVFAVREEMARSVEDVLARRTRALFRDARVAMEMAPRTAELLARELRRDSAWRTAQVDAFREVAAGYLLSAAAD